MDRRNTFSVLSTAAGINNVANLGKKAIRSQTIYLLAIRLNLFAYRSWVLLSSNGHFRNFDNANVWQAQVPESEAATTKQGTAMDINVWRDSTCGM